MGPDSYDDNGIALVVAVQEAPKERPCYRACVATLIIMAVLGVAIVGIRSEQRLVKGALKDGQQHIEQVVVAEEMEKGHDEAQCELAFSDFANRTFLDEIVRKVVVANHTSDRCDEIYMENHMQTKCLCGNPIQPASLKSGNWPSTFQRNKELAQQEKRQKLDVVMLGDSITEHWLGTSHSRKKPGLKGHNAVYRELFTQPSSAVQGLALGIGADQSTNLLYRLQNGEMDPNLQPNVWWVSIGTNNLPLGSCNSEAMFVGIRAVVEHILRERPDATVVVNSILPKGELRTKTAKFTFSFFFGKLSQNVDWPVLDRLNHMLQCFAASMENVEFFNATDLFLDDGTDDMNVTLYSDPVHPSAVGHRVWGEAIVEKVLQIKNSKKK